MSQREINRQYLPGVAYAVGFRISMMLREALRHETATSICEFAYKLDHRNSTDAMLHRSWWDSWGNVDAAYICIGAAVNQSVHAFSAGQESRAFSQKATSEQRILPSKLKRALAIQITTS